MTSSLKPRRPLRAELTRESSTLEDTLLTFSLLTPRRERVPMPTLVRRTSLRLLLLQLLLNEENPNMFLVSICSDKKVAKKHNLYLQICILLWQLFVVRRFYLKLLIDPTIGVFLIDLDIFVISWEKRWTFEK